MRADSRSNAICRVVPGMPPSDRGARPCRIASVKVVSLVLALLVAAPPGAAIAAPDAAPPAPPAPPPAPAPDAAPLALPALPVLPAPPPAPAPSDEAAPAGGPATGLSLGPPSLMGPPSEAGARLAPVVVGAEVPRPREKSPLVAFSLSFSMPIAVVAGAALHMELDPGEEGGVPLATAVLGMIVGPSTGWLYAGRPGLAMLTTGMRLGGALLVAPLLDSESTEAARPLLGMAIFATATLIDWIGPPISVANGNERARKATVVPMVTPGGGAGLSFAGAF
jgi:hypothetical protein